MNVYNFLSFFNRLTDVKICDTKSDCKVMYNGKVEDLTTSEALTWEIVSVFIFSGVLTIYVEVEE